MNFLVDAQLPRRLALFLTGQGHPTLHTLDLPRANMTADMELIETSIREGRVLITKDRDFVPVVSEDPAPWKLLLVSTGNLGNAELLELFGCNLSRLVTVLDQNRFVEIARGELIIHY